jgi:hypothetical protein
MKVGDTVFVVKRGGKETYTATIKAFGRKWATLNSYDKFDVNTFVIESRSGYLQSGKVYENEAAYKEEQVLLQKWKQLRTQIEGIRLPDASKMDAVAEILGIKME